MHNRAPREGVGVAEHPSVRVAQSKGEALKSIMAAAVARVCGRQCCGQQKIS